MSRLLGVLGLGLLLGLAGPSPGAWAAEFLVSDDGQARGERVAAVLADLERGDVRALAHIDAELLLAPLAVVEEEGALLRHWSLPLAGSVGRLPAERRAHAERLLTALWQRWPVADGRDRLSSRLAFVPAVATELQRRADRAFDLGHFTTFLLLDERLGGSSGQRRDIAAGLAGQRALGQQPDARLAPGPVQTWLSPPPEIGGHEAWRRDGEALTGRGPFGELLWQRRITSDDRVLVGPRFSLVVGTQTRLIDRTGRSWSLDLPATCTPFAVGWDRLWCQHEPELLVAHDKQGRAVGSIRLPEAPICAPLPATAGRWYWLTPHWLVLSSAQGVVAQWRHDQALAGERWRLRRLLDRVALVGDDGSVLSMQPLRRGLDGLPVEEQVAWWLRARQPERALQAGGADDAARPTDPAAISLRLATIAAVCARSPASVPAAAQAELLAALTDGTTDTRPLDEDQCRALWMLAQQAATSALRERSAGLLADHAVQAPATWFCLAGDPFLQPASWQHALTLAGWLRGGGAPSDPARQLGETTVTAGRRPLLRRWSHPVHGSLRCWDDRSFRLLRTETGTEVVGYSADGETVLWRQGWRTPAWLPSRQLSWRDGYLLITEAQHRFHVLHPVDGRVLASYRIPSGLAFPGQTAVLRPESLAVLSPLGVRTQLHFLTPGTEPPPAVALPGPARWAIPWQHADQLGVLVQLADGRSLFLRPGQLAGQAQPIDLPPLISDSARPDWSTAGLWVDAGLLPSP